MSEPVINSYLPLNDDEEKIEEEAERKKETPRDRFSPEEERAFAVGLATLICFAALAIILVSWYLVRKFNSSKEITESPQQTEQNAPKKEVLGVQNAPENQTLNPNSAPASLTGKTYTVESGNTLYTIGQKLNIDWQKIADLNNLERPYNLRVGQELALPE